MSVLIFIVDRVNSVKNLSSIAVALGAERARNELLPYILGKQNTLKNFTSLHRLDGR